MGGFDRALDKRLGSLPAVERPYKLDDPIIADSYKHLSEKV